MNTKTFIHESCQCSRLEASLWSFGYARDLMGRSKKVVISQLMLILSMKYTWTMVRWNCNDRTYFSVHGHITVPFLTKLVPKVALHKELLKNLQSQEWFRVSKFRGFWLIIDQYRRLMRITDGHSKSRPPTHILVLMARPTWASSL